MNPPATSDAIKKIRTHYIDGAFVPSHGRDVVDMIRLTDRWVIARATPADEEDIPIGETWPSSAAASQCSKAVACN